MADGTGTRQLVWEELKSSRAGGGMFTPGWDIHRTKVPGGWLVLVINNPSGLTFYPDAEHNWTGSSMG
jgi:hypothetical protein